MDINTHPLAYRLTSKSTNALIVWALLYAMDTPNAVTRESLERSSKGDKYDRAAVAILSPYA
jgi:hypothetical protein